jgi:hypothetical protein
MLRIKDGSMTRFNLRLKKSGSVLIALQVAVSSTFLINTDSFADGLSYEPRLYRSAHFLGRGDTGIAVADEEDAIFYNPAGLALGKGIYKKTVLLSPQVELSEATRDLARRLGAENANAVETVQNNIGKPNHFGLQNFTGLVLRRAALGAIVSNNIDLLAYKSAEYGGMEVVEANVDQNIGATFSLADTFFMPKLMMGITAKYLARGRGSMTVISVEADKVTDELSNTADFIGMGEGGGLDFGLMYQGGGRTNPSFGLTINDIGDTKITPTEETNLDLDLKQQINIGGSIEPGTKFSKLKLLMDYRDIAGTVIKNPYKRFHMGGELSVLNMIGIMGGINQGYPTAGLYFDFYILRLDLGYYTQEMGKRIGTRPDTRYFVRLEAGF